MEKEEIEGYIIHKKYSEHYTPMNEGIEEYLGYIKKVRLSIINELDTKRDFRTNSGKNKGLKKKVRGQIFKKTNSRVSRPGGRFGSAFAEYDPVHLTNIIKMHIPAKYIMKEIPAGIYMLCPFHNEKTPSCCISKELGIVKCFGCGQSWSLHVFLSMVLGNSALYWHKILSDEGSINPPNQLEIDFSSNQSE